MAAALVALALVLLGGSPAAAHAELVETDPAEGAVVETAPETVTLTFNEPVRLTSQEIAVYDAGGDPVASTAGATGAEVTVGLTDAAGLEDGTYVVSWNVLSGDGHPISGALTFSVGAPSADVTAPPEPESSSAVVTVLRDVVTVGLAARPARRRGARAFHRAGPPPLVGGHRRPRRIRRLLTVAAGVGAAGAVLQVPIASVYGQGLELGDLVAAFDPGARHQRAA